MSSNVQMEIIEQVLDPETWVDKHGDYLFRYAWNRLQSRQVAEDVVQETFVSALGSLGRFEGRASERTWLLSILRHKIIDYIRKVSRERPLKSEKPPEDLPESHFSEDGEWSTKPSQWDMDPRKVLENKEFWEVVRHCLTELPERMAHAFALRELEGLNSEEISKLMEITSNYLGVILYRARHQLRHCLEIKWFTE